MFGRHILHNCPPRSAVWPCDPVIGFCRFWTVLLGNVLSHRLSVDAKEPANFSLGMARVAVMAELPAAILALHCAGVNPAVPDG